MSDPHGGPPPPFYASHADLADDVSRWVASGAELRFGVVSARTDPTTHDTGTVTVNGIRMPYLTACSPQVGDTVAWLEAESVRLCIGEYGTDISRVKSWISTTIGLGPGSVFDISFNVFSTTEYQQNFDHSLSFFPALFSPLTAGLFDVAGGIHFAAGDGTIRALYLKINGTIEVEVNDFTPNGLFPTFLSFNVPFELAAGDTLTLSFFHNASTSLNAGTGRGRTYLSAVRRAASD